MFIRKVTQSIEPGERLTDWRDGDEAEVYTIALSPNGKTVATCKRKQGRDVETRKVAAKSIGHIDVVWAACWSVDGRRVVSGCDDVTIGAWDVLSGGTVLGSIKRYLHV